LALALCAGLAARSAELVTLTGKKSAGTLVAVTADLITFKDESGAELKVPVKELSAVDLGNKVVAPAKDARYDEVELTDGSVLRVSGLKLKDKKVEVVPLAGGAAPTLDVPMVSVYWFLRAADDPRNRDDWRKLLSKRGKRDLIVIRQPTDFQTIPGTVIGGDETGDRFTFEREDDGTRATLPLTRATAGLVFNQPPRDQLPPTVCKVHDVLGNVLFATSVEVAGAGLKVKTVSGAAVEYPDLAAVSKLDFSQGNVSYLSDLQADAAYAPAETDGPIGEAVPYAVTLAKDKALFGADIVLRGKKFPRGVSVPPDAVLTYKLDGTFREFKATAGILDEVKPENCRLRLRVSVDGREVLNEVVSKKDPPKEITLNVKDAKELKIAVERESLTLAANQLNLADARVQK
jgi:hypothetical protein